MLSIKPRIIFLSWIILTMAKTIKRKTRVSKVLKKKGTRNTKTRKLGKKLKRGGMPAPFFGASLQKSYTTNPDATTSGPMSKNIMRASLGPMPKC